MNLFECTKHEKRSITRTYSHAVPSTPMSPNVLDDDEEDEIDYSPIIQQEADGKSSKHI